MNSPPPRPQPPPRSPPQPGYPPSSSQSPQHPPPFSEFDFSFDPALQPFLAFTQQLHPTNPGHLFSQSETSNLLGYLDAISQSVDVGFDERASPNPGSGEGRGIDPRLATMDYDSATGSRGHEHSQRMDVGESRQRQMEQSYYSHPSTSSSQHSSSSSIVAFPPPPPTLDPAPRTDGGYLDNIEYPPSSLQAHPTGGSARVGPPTRSRGRGKAGTSSSKSPTRRRDGSQTRASRNSNPISQSLPLHPQSHPHSHSQMPITLPPSHPHSPHAQHLHQTPSPHLSPTLSSASAPSSAPTSSLQKRTAHILSEQKRRNAIRDSYSTLISFLAPEDGTGGEGLEMPTRGRPKGSGLRAVKPGKTKEVAGGKGAKGKSGILWRAVEYTLWLQEGNEALKRECERLEGLLGGARQ